MVPRPTPLATSLPELRRDVEWQMRSNPELEAHLNSGAIQIPSLAALVARMQASHPSRLSADRYRGTLPIKWAIQRRTLRKASQDAHYVNCVGLFAHQFVLECADRGNNVLSVSDDDKCTISIGQLGLSQTAAT